MLATLAGSIFTPVGLVGLRVNSRPTVASTAVTRKSPPARPTFTDLGQGYAGGPCEMVAYNNDCYVACRVRGINRLDTSSAKFGGSSSNPQTQFSPYSSPLTPYHAPANHERRGNLSPAVGPRSGSPAGARTPFLLEVA